MTCCEYCKFELPAGAVRFHDDCRGEWVRRAKTGLCTRCAGRFVNAECVNKTCRGRAEYRGYPP